MIKLYDYKRKTKKVLPRPLRDVAFLPVGSRRPLIAIHVIAALALPTASFMVPPVPGPQAHRPSGIGDTNASMHVRPCGVAAGDGRYDDIDFPPHPRLLARPLPPVGEVRR